MRDVKNVIRESQRLAGLQIFAMSQGGFSAEEQAAYGVTADGAPAEGGLTPKGVEVADMARQGVNSLARDHFERHQREHRQAAGRPASDPLGLTGPIRAALKAGATALAAALDDGESDGGRSGVQVDEDGNEFEMIKVGHKPYVLIELEEHEDMPGVTMLGITAGGGVARDTDPDRMPGQPTVGEMLEKASEANAASTAAGVGDGEIGIVNTTDGAVSPEDAERATAAMREAFGDRVRHVRTPRRRGGEGGADVAGAEALIRGLLGADFMPLRESQGSGAGPSTEAPSRPHWPDTPRTGDGEAPAGPVRDDERVPASSPVVPLRDDAGTPPPSDSATSAPEAASSGGGTDSAGSACGGSE